MVRTSHHIEILLSICNTLQNSCKTTFKISKAKDIVGTDGIGPFSS